jgi:hypothetical protein
VTSDTPVRPIDADAVQKFILIAAQVSGLQDGQWTHHRDKKSML